MRFLVLISRVYKISEYYGTERPRDALTLTQSDIVMTSYGTVAAEFVLNNKNSGDTQIVKQCQLQ